MKKIALPKSKAKTAYGLLSEIRKLILAEPRRLRMGSWFTLTETLLPIERPACGTVCCIAGWAITLKGSRRQKASGANSFGFRESRAFIAGRQILGISADDAVQLFTHEGIDAEEGTAKHAAVAAARIATFQETHARQLKAKAV